MHHEFPVGIIDVPKNVDRDRIVEGRTFLCDKWSDPGTRKFKRWGVDHPQLLPSFRETTLDVDVLKQLGLTADRIEKKYSLWFL